jgi:exosortase
MKFMVHKRFLVWLFVSVFAWWPALKAFVRAGVSNDDYSYTLLVLGSALVLLCLERWPRPREDKSPVPRLLVLLVVVTCFAWWNFRIPMRGGDVRLTLSILSWIVFVVAVFVQSYGWRPFSGLSFPFLFSLLAVPLPTRVIEPIVVALQWGSADVAYALFRIFHVPVARDGLVFSFSKVEIEVAEECSSIRSSTILVVTTLMIAQLFLKSKLNKLLVVLIAVPISVLKNGVRIVTLSLLAEYVSLDWLNSPLHRQGGFIFLSFGLAIMITVIWLLARAEIGHSQIPQLEGSTLGESRGKHRG